MAANTVLLTGASGLLGTWLRRTAPAGVDIVGLTNRTRLNSRSVSADLRDRQAVVAAVDEVRPSLLIHAAYARDRPSIVDATQHVMAAARRTGADVLYVSTDAVFAGDGIARAEDAIPDPTWDYGRWKAATERVVSEGAERSAIVRLPLIVSLDPDDHAVARLRQGAARNDPTEWFDDEFRQPAAAPELAAAVWRIALLSTDDRAGAWHLPGPETLSRYAIAQRVVMALDLPASTITARGSPASTDRPRHLNISDHRARTRIGWLPSPILRSQLSS